MPAPNQHPRANSPIASKRLLLIPALSTPVIRITPSCPCGQGSRGLRWPAPAASAAGENSGGIAWRMEPPRGIAPHDVQPPGLEPRPWRWLCDFAGERPFLLAGAARGARKSKPYGHGPRRARRPACACDLRCHDGPRVPGAGSRCAHPGTVAPQRRRPHRMRV
jgi:hypothetical protein